MSRVLVTGCGGALGTPLVRELRRRGHDVWGCELQHAADEQVIRADVRSYRQLERLFEQIGDFDYVYHLAAEFGRHNGEEYFENLWETNVIGTRNVLELQRRRPFRLIFASSSEIYGDLPHPILSEDIPLSRSIVQHNDYATTKWVNEVQIMNFEKRYGSECLRLRFFNAYGPGEYYHKYRSVVCLFSYRALHNLPYTVYRGYRRDFTYIEDFTPTLANACQSFNAGEVYNIGGSTSVSIEELSGLVLAQLGKSDELVTYLDQDVHNVRSKRPDISRAVRDLGHNPQVSLEEGLARTLEWMRGVYLSNERRPPQPLGDPV